MGATRASPIVRETTTMSEDGFLSRWSQRKRATLRGEAPPEPLAEPPVAAPEPIAEAVPAPAEEAPFDPASLPPVESLTAESDFLPFLARNVPPLLKRAALRRMWSLDIGIRDYIGPADYAWDYNAVDGVPGSSLDLVGDVRKLLAQAIGAPPEEEKEAADVATAATDTADDAPECTSEKVPSHGEGDAPSRVADDTLSRALDDTPSHALDDAPSRDAEHAPPPNPLRLSATPAEPAPPAATKPPRLEPRPRRHGAAAPA